MQSHQISFFFLLFFIAIEQIKGFRNVFLTTNHAIKISFEILFPEGAFSMSVCNMPKFISINDEACLFYCSRKSQKLTHKKIKIFTCKNKSYMKIFTHGKIYCSLKLNLQSKIIILNIFFLHSSLLESIIINNMN